MFAMRKIALSVSAAALFLGAQPVLAQEVGGIEDALPHPFEVEEAGDRFGRLLDALLDVPVGGVVQSLDPAAPVARDDSVADIAGRDDPAFRDKLQDRVGAMSLKLADAMRMVRAAAPKLRESLERMERDFGDVLEPEADR